MRINTCFALKCLRIVKVMRSSQNEYNNVSFSQMKFRSFSREEKRSVSPQCDQWPFTNCYINSKRISSIQAYSEMESIDDMSMKFIKVS